MTNEEAKEITQIAITAIKRGGTGNTEYLDVVLKAIEKQIPKKPVGPAILLEGGGAKCPTCGKAFCTECWKTKHCCICGQALNWGDKK